MSKQGPAGSLTLVILIVVLGIVSLFDILLFFAFIAALGYYLYKVERRVMDLEAAAASRGILPPKKHDKE